MWSDNETDEDLLGFEIHARLVKSIITDAEMLPVTVGLFGDWGGGKSSVLKILERSIDPSAGESSEYLVVRFDTWIFEGYEDAKTAILAVLLKELRDNKTLGSKIGDEVRELLKRVNWMKVGKVGFAVGLSMLASNPLPLLVASGSQNKVADEGSEKEAGGKKVGDGESWLRAAEESTADIKSFRRDFAALIKKTGLKSLVVILDDLDRCMPERVVENLEAIKLFLNVPGVAFVVAADRRIVENAIRVRYANTMGALASDQERQELATDYLEKLVQVPYHLPKLAPHEVRSYWSLLLCKKIVTEQFEHVHRVYQGFIEKNRYETFNLWANVKFLAGDPRKAHLEEQLGIIETCSEAITVGLKGNPRQIKRFLNSLWIRLELAKLGKLDKLNRPTLVKLMVLEYIDGEKFRKIYESLKEDGSSELLAELEQFADDGSLGGKHSDWSKNQLARWLTAEPRLKGVDLRDYFWISRGSLADAFAGIQLLSLAVRTCVDRFLLGDIKGRSDAVALFKQLDAREQSQALQSLSREAASKPEEPQAWEALLDLGKEAGKDAAERLVATIKQADKDKINIRIAHGLVGLKDKGNGNEGTGLLIKAIPELASRGGKFAAILKKDA